MAWLDFLQSRGLDANAANEASDKSEASSNPAAGAVTDEASAAGDTGAKPAGAEPSSAENDPLALYLKMHDNSDKAEAGAVPSLSLTGEVVNETASKLNFVDGISQEDMVAATSGDTEALMRLMQQVGRNAYGNALQHATALTDRHVAARSEFDSKHVGAAVRSEFTTRELSDQIKGFEHPVVRAQLTETAQQIARTYPDKSPQEVASMARDYMTHVTAQSLGIDVEALRKLQEQSSAKASTQTSRASEVKSWDDYFTQ